MVLAKALPIGPVVAYGHPKTATRSIEAALSTVAGVEAFHAHMLEPSHFTRKNNVFVPPMASGLCPEDQPAQWGVSEALKANDRMALISAVRDPVAVNVSWFFFGLQRWLRSRRPVDPARVSFERLTTVFRDLFPHEGILNWFTEEWTKVTGVELARLDGVREEGHVTVSFGKGRACVLSAHLSDDRKAEILENFLDLPQGTVSFPRVNRGVDRRSPEVYERLKVLVASDEAYLEKMYGSAYAQHFFTGDQIKAFRASWQVIAEAGGSIPRVAQIPNKP